MKVKKSQKSSWFQDMYRKYMSRQSQMIFAACSCAFVFSFAFIGMMRMEIGGNSLLASVTNLNNQATSVDFDADIALKHHAQHLEIVVGKNMQSVDFIEGIIAFDPNTWLQLSQEQANISLTEENPGMYRFRIDMNHKNITSGTIVASFSKNHENLIPLSFIDTQFVSGNERYNLMNTLLMPSPH